MALAAFAAAAASLEQSLLADNGAAVKIVAGLAGGLIALGMRLRFLPPASLVSQGGWKVPATNSRQARSPLYGVHLQLNLGSGGGGGGGGGDGSSAAAAAAAALAAAILEAATLGVGLMLFEVQAEAEAEAEAEAKAKAQAEAGTEAGTEAKTKAAAAGADEPPAPPHAIETLVGDPNERRDMTVWLRPAAGGVSADALSTARRAVAALGAGYADVLVVDAGGSSSSSSDDARWQAAWRRAEEAVEAGVAKFLALDGTAGLTEERLRAVCEWAAIKPVALLMADGNGGGGRIGSGGGGGEGDGAARDAGEDERRRRCVERAKKDFGMHIAVLSPAGLTSAEATAVAAPGPASAGARRMVGAVAACARESDRTFGMALAAFRQSCGATTFVRGAAPGALAPVGELSRAQIHEVTTALLSDAERQARESGGPVWLQAAPKTAQCPVL